MGRSKGSKNKPKVKVSKTPVKSEETLNNGVEEKCYHSSIFNSHESYVRKLKLQEGMKQEDVPSPDFIPRGFNTMKDIVAYAKAHKIF